MRLHPGHCIAGRYRVVGLAGRGGLGDLYRVDDERLGVSRALKQLRKPDDERLAAFRSEFLLLAGVTHPRLTRVLDFGSARLDDAIVHYYVADWVHGETLGARALHVSPSSLLPAVLDALDGLSALHELGMRHGDFTPDNVMIDADGHGVLIDLGCARGFGDRGATVSGTPGFLAPELLAEGSGDARADLYAVGATLQSLYGRAGAEPEGAVADVVQRLLAEHPSERPATAYDVIEALGGRPGRSWQVPAVARRIVGRDAEIEAVQRWLADASTGAADVPAFGVVGAPGSGKTRFLRETALRAEADVDVLRTAASEPRPVAWLLATASGEDEIVVTQKNAISAARRAGRRERPLLLVVDDVDQLESVERDVLWAFVRSIEPGARVAVLFSTGAAAKALPVRWLELAPLGRDALAAWTRGALSQGALDALLAATSGLPASVEAELTLRDERARPGDRGPGTGRDAFRAWLAKLDVEGARAMAILAARGGRIETSAWPSWDAALTPALASPFVRRDGTRLALRDAEKLETLIDWLGPARLEEAHRRLAELLATFPADAKRSAEGVRHATLGRALEYAERGLAAAEPLWRAEPRVFVSRVRELARTSRDARTLQAITEIALGANEPELALATATRWLGERTAPGGAEARLLGAEALIRLGRGARAERLLRPLLSSRRPRDERARACERLARARLQLGNPAGAERAARDGLDLAPEPRLAVSLDEALGLAVSYLGRGAEAEACFARALAGLDEDSHPRDRCRIFGHRAILAHRSGRIAEAVEDHARALELAERHGEDDLVAVCSLNLGTAEQQLGELGRALGHYERGLAVARAVGRESTELTLLYNLANLRAEIGDLGRAAADLERLELRGRELELAHFAPAIALVRAEIALVEERLDAAGGELETAERLYTERRLERELVEVTIRGAELALARSDPGAAAPRAEDAKRRAHALGARDLALRAALVHGKAALASGDATGVIELESAREVAAERGPRSLEAELETELWRAAEARSPEESAARARRAERAWGRLAASLPEELRAIFWRDPRRLRLARFTRTHAVPASEHDGPALARVLSLARRINSTLSLERVLDYAVDAAVQLSGAERGFLLLVSNDGGADVAAAHEPAGSGEPPSRGIVQRVLSSEEPILTTDAESDERFRGQGSVHALRLKSVLCVPIATPASVVGALYVDTRVQRARFGPADQGLLLALADQIAVAVTNARLHAELESRARELELRKETIERLSRKKDRELHRLRERVELTRRAFELRYDYSRIVGRGPKMRAVLEKLDRIIDSEASVLVQGESGTGKELVARALHVNGARKDRPFLGVNCAALPEALLESELFGHVRGAFTGADRDKAGLLLAADGGTLFLDEIGDLPLATQAKLLRVLQEREVRPLGAERSVAIDVRLVSATHRDLASDVREGRFREDLFYRIAVVGVELPPLRERVEDIPELARSILARLAREASRTPPELSRDALRALALHPFPGNVRELENVLTRAFVLSPGARIGAADLELATAKPARRSTSRREFEAEERERILDALRASRWNVSTVARVLGVPRNTLYRKLARYGLTRPESPPLSDEVSR